MLASPRGKYLVVERVNESTLSNGINYPHVEGKDLTRLECYKVISVGPLSDCEDIVKGSKMLVSEDAVQKFQYQGKELCLVDEAYCYGYLNV